MNNVVTIEMLHFEKKNLQMTVYFDGNTSSIETTCLTYNILILLTLSFQQIFYDAQEWGVGGGEE